jgi:spermidine/putrescine transport system substrate-binding protein
MGAGASAMSMTAWLASCGIQGQSGGGASGGGAAEDELATTEIQGELDIANWPLYIDRKKGRRPTLDDFEKTTGIDVTYKEVIQDNAEFFGTINEPLSSGDVIEYDMLVLSDWMIANMIRLDYLEEVDHSRLPNFGKHAGAIYQDPVRDHRNRLQRRAYWA